MMIISFNRTYVSAYFTQSSLSVISLVLYNVIRKHLVWDIDMRYIYILRKVQHQRFGFKVTGKQSFIFFLKNNFFPQSKATPPPKKSGIDQWWCKYAISFFQLFSIYFYIYSCMLKVKWLGHNMSPVVYTISISQYDSF